MIEIQTKGQKNFPENFEEIKYFFKDRYKVMQFNNEDCSHSSMSIFCCHLNKLIKNEEPKNQFVRWLPRVVIIGRNGSGRKTQSILLAQEFNLIYGKILLIFLSFV